MCMVHHVGKPDVSHNKCLGTCLMALGGWKIACLLRKIRSWGAATAAATITITAENDWWVELDAVSIDGWSAVVYQNLIFVVLSR